MVRTRIAPSPTGYPHIGTVYQALFDYVFAHQQNGTFIIRIEDTDRSRLVEEAENVIYQALEYYGLRPDEGPKYGGEYGPYRQSERLEIYQHHAQNLIESGHAYYCFCSPERLDQVRKDRQAQGLPPMYDQHCRNLDQKEAKKRAETEAHVIRLKVPANETITFTDKLRGEISFESSTVDDQVLIKSDGFPTYHLAVVVDDHEMKITHIIRGEEWISSTPKHILLYRAFGWDIPEIIHLPLLRNPNRSKISKRHGHTSAFWYREEGYLVEAVINFLATRVWNHPEGMEVFSLEELIKFFKFEDMHIQGPIVDLDKLNWLNGQWIRRLTDEELIDRLKPYSSPQLSLETLQQLIPHLKDRLVKLSEINQLTEYFYQTPPVPLKELRKEFKGEPAALAQYLEKAAATIAAVEKWTVTELENALRKLQEAEQLKPRPAFMSLRLAVTGKAATPPLFDVIQLLGKEESVKRLQHAAAEIKKN